MLIALSAAGQTAILSFLAASVIVAAVVVVVWRLWQGPFRSPPEDDPRA